jgi:hypothetical protein
VLNLQGSLILNLVQAKLSVSQKESTADVRTQKQGGQDNEKDQTCRGLDASKTLIKVSVHKKGFAS